MSEIQFRPIQGLQDNIIGNPISRPGAVYFATDSGKIYLDTAEGERLLMGGNSTVFYGTKEISEEEIGSGQKEFYFAINEIENTESGLANSILPAINDLILNQDGCFYRVTDLEYSPEIGELALKTTKLTIAGSGGGGGGTNTGAGKIDFQVIGSLSGTFIYKSPYNISFYFEATDHTGTSTGNGTYWVKDATGKTIVEGTAIGGGITTVDVGSHITTSSLGIPMSLKLYYSGDTGGTSWPVYSRTFNLTPTLFETKWEYVETQVNPLGAANQRFKINYTVTAPTDAVTTTYIKINNYAPVATTSKNGYEFYLSDYNIGHEVVKMEIYSTIELEGTSEPQPSNHITKNVMFATFDENSPDYGVTLLSCPFFETSLRQYDTVKIPIIAYNNKNLSNELNLSLSDTGVDKGGFKNVANGEVKEWNYTPTVSGSHTLRIKEDMSNKEVIFDVNVEEVTLKVSENTDYEFKFKSTEFASNDTVQTWTTKDGSLIQFSENFDWENGGLKEEINDKGISEPVFVVKAGSTMTIPYKPFLKTGVNGLGKTFKFIFKAKNCRSFNAPVLSCQVEQLRITIDSAPSSTIVALGSEISYGKNIRINKDTNTIEYRGSSDTMTYTQENLADEEKREKLLNTYILYQGQYYYCKEFNEQTSFVEDENGESVSVTYYVPNLHLTTIKTSYKGLRMEAQSAVFNSDINTISTQYCENSYIEYELNLNDKYMTSWIDGVPNSISLYDNIADSILQPMQTAQYITIGSSECDVYVYLIKFYETSLSTEDHFGNFVLDAANATEMIERYTRNDILDQKNEISPVLLAMKNPDCKVHVYTIPRITTSKDDKIKNCEYIQYQGREQPILQAEGVTTRVQGTSSAAYGLAAYNIDADFRKATKFIDYSKVATGESLLKGRKDDDEDYIQWGWSMRENSIPCCYFTTKVNVASPENANNALNQEWYNRFQPYKTVLRCKNENARDCMEFTPGVLFLKDTNVTNLDGVDNVFKDTSNYLTEPYPKLYAICNMGNSKKNVHVFHDITNPLECCIEVNDNQAPQQWMISDAYSDMDFSSESGEGADYYGFRYPDIKIEEIDDIPNGRQFLKNWRRFVSWMAHSNPQPAYEKVESIVDAASFEAARINPYTGAAVTLYRFEETDEKHTVVTEYDSNIQNYYQRTVHPYGYTNERLPEFEENYLIVDEESFNTYKTNPNIKVFVKTESNSFIEAEDYKAGTKYYRPVRKTFAQKEFSGYKADEKIQSNYTPILKGYLCSAYNTDIITYYECEDGTETTNLSAENIKIAEAAGEYNGYQHDEGDPIIARKEVQQIQYEYDTYEYRMAKMLDECEDYLVMDSVVFHYLFIERHCMIDNVAKNTFWSTEDGGLHWNLTKNYDNDTADGNDNNGKFTRSYGMETQDRLNANEFVFNAHQSVWLKFIEGLPDVCKHMYKALETVQIGKETKSAWDPNYYLETFSRWQKSIPERCWIEAYYRLYRRPYEVYGSTTFLSMLEGGQKTHQRKQFETYQNYYISSKYFGNTASGSSILLRGSGTGKLNYALPVKLYSDAYVQVAIGSGQNPNITARVKGGEEYLIRCPLNNLNNTTFYMYTPQLYTEIGTNDDDDESRYKGNLGGFGIAQYDFSHCEKLQKLVLGGTRSHDQDNDQDLSENGMNLNNILLREFIFGKYTNDNPVAINLSACPSLEVFNTAGSNVNSITIAPGSPLRELIAEGPSTLLLEKMYYLTTVDMDASAISSLDLIDIDHPKISIDENKKVNSKTHFLDPLRGNYNPVTYLLKDVDWKITKQENEIKLETKSIDILDYLLDEDNSPKIIVSNDIGASYAASVTGTLTIAENAYRGLNTMDLYNKYINSERFGGLDMIFEGAGYLPRIDIYNGDNKVIWTSRVQNGTLLTQQILSNSSASKGAYNYNDVVKRSTDIEIFVHNNTWQVYKNNVLVDANFQATLDETTGWYYPLYNVTDASGNVLGITEDIKLIPNFTPETRTYEVTIYNTDGEEVLMPTTSIAAGTFLSALAANIKPTIDDSDLPITETYRFIGYRTKLDTRTTVDIKHEIIDTDTTYYATYEAISVYDNVNWDYFTVSTGAIYEEYIEGNAAPMARLSYLDGSNYTQEQFDWINPSALGRDQAETKNGCVLFLTGKAPRKLTIPSTYIDDNDNEHPVLTVFLTKKGSIADLEYIFFKSTNDQFKLFPYAFAAGSLSLKDIYNVPKSLRVIGNSAFSGCAGLKFSNQLLGSNTIAIGSKAFAQAFSAEISPQEGQVVTTLLKIPASVITIGAGAFQYNNSMENTGIWTGIDIGTEGNLSKLEVPQVFLSDTASENQKKEASIFRQNASFKGVQGEDGVKFFSMRYRDDQVSGKLQFLTLIGEVPIVPFVIK